MLSLLSACENFWNNSRLPGIENIIMCYSVYIFIKIQSSPTHGKISRINWSRLHPDKLFATTVRFIIRFAGKIFQNVIISVFSMNVCTQICYNGWGGANPLVLISPPHKPCDLFWLVGDRFTAAEVFHQHANTDVPIEWKMSYNSNDWNAYNQVTQITHLNFNWGMLGVSSYL